ncbi:ketopantoate reductase PanE/ApbA C terminal-domain-containing protein [Clohesyomyces aquaticus]|uniref:Ketopantoate reductase PanE/ApbA C terminal-domain-containing protein n=1 Tax=Clohesyomyces aquaticus TaxID=1231657 RepID=A0A1Y1YWY9_9PLEO|nr:ketopantoate reductase PanE/ApbA C terminal-domain-containing protein [Clohesyomyces aquaticus]
MGPQAKEGASAGKDGKDGKDGSPNLEFTSQNVASFYRQQSIYDRRVHILGVGSVGRLIAHSLRGIPNPPPVTLLFHRGELLKVWNESSKKLQLITDGRSEKRSGYDVELAIPRPRFHGKEIGPEENVQDPSAPSVPQHGPSKLADGESNELINSLILCVKAPQVLSSLSAVKHRLHPESVILFVQNGMGVVEEVNKEIFPDPQTRPHYMLGINSHGVNTSPDDPFTATYAGFGTMSLGIMPHERIQPRAPYSAGRRFKPGYSEDAKGPVTSKHPANPDPNAGEPMPYFFKWTPNSRYLLRTMLRSPVLCAAAFSPPDLLQMQLEKLAVNCIINPLTVMLDARNGSILYNYHLTRVLRLLLSEISLVVRSLPELQYIPNVEQRFDPGRLETIVVGVANKTRDNISSMLADVRAGRRTEIEYINGWVVGKGEDLGIRCFMNYMMVNLVKGKNAMIELEMAEGVPFVEAKRGEGEIKIRGIEREDQQL